MDSATNGSSPARRPCRARVALCRPTAASRRARRLVLRLRGNAAGLGWSPAVRSVHDVSEPTSTHPGVATRADFSAIRYAQCWEDADVLVEALAPAAGQTLVSIASAGDNTLALLTGSPARVIAIDLNPAQLACLELRVAAYRELAHGSVLELIGSRPSPDRRALYTRCRSQLSRTRARSGTRAATRSSAASAGRGSSNATSRIFRRGAAARARPRPREPTAGRRHARRARAVLPRRVGHLALALDVPAVLLARGDGPARARPGVLPHVEGSVAARILARTRHALTVLDPADNPYLHWILSGRHSDRAAAGAAAGALRHDSRQPRPARVAPRRPGQRPRPLGRPACTAAT